MLAHSLSGDGNSFFAHRHTQNAYRFIYTISHEEQVLDNKETIEKTDLQARMIL